ncbi:hypothetical protein [Elizabethkingia miricola]|uniref:hypothetical protein n=1 Tax=Elizabethkingia miricola TaxID=172045 RepID=UPI000B35B41A|nr:hypothetical protein [Elizabethkingia miricola]
MSKKEFQKKAKALLEAYPEQNKVVISENGQCFFDEIAAKAYHENMGFESEPETFFREGYGDEDDQDLQEALHNATLEKSLLSGVIDEVLSVANLDEEYEPATKDTDETVIAVIALREKYTLAVQENASVVEKLSTAQTENETLKSSLEEAVKENKALKEQLKNLKTTKDATKTDSKEA